jgi:hypothetical protein
MICWYSLSYQSMDFSFSLISMSWSTLLAVSALELGVQHLAKILEDLRDDAVGVEVLLQPLHCESLQRSAPPIRRSRLARRILLVHAVA